MFGIGREVYYRAINAQKSSQETTNRVIEIVQKVRLRQRKVGTRKLYEMCSKEFNSLKIGRDRLFKILKANHMLIKPKRQYHITTDSHHHFHKHKNIVKDLSIIRPEQVWVSDITYVGTRSNPMYLALVTDAYSKKIMGYDLSNSLSASGSVRALEMAIKQGKYSKESLIHHSDRGLQYCCNDYQEVLGQHNIKCSMTVKYDPYENAIAERINGILKQEFILGVKFKDINLMKTLIKESIQIYNQERLHYSNYYKTPEEMHQQRAIKMRTYKKNKKIASLFPTMLSN